MIFMFLVLVIAVRWIYVYHQKNQFGGRLRYKHVKHIKQLVKNGASWFEIENYVNWIYPTNTFAQVTRNGSLEKIRIYYIMNGGKD